MDSRLSDIPDSSIFDDHRRLSPSKIRSILFYKFYILLKQDFPAQDGTLWANHQPNSIQILGYFHVEQSEDAPAVART